ncbi:hypothetical protein NQ314_006575 [Rhamnusium bicolor]|uniref:DDE Tnp4 domain-containing protein n=1 Tax=Rhamnusium bicolor TaxID=1586634 RepID=A0AAV8Z271_9CUCU|nr:hypothetical protein NQ314_006575 [Rhamnusium bicolor]
MNTVLLALVDASYRFIYIDVETNGRMNDASILSKSLFNEKLITNAFNFLLNRSDDVFPLRTNLLKPYSRIGTLSQKQKIFNYRLSRVRRIVENVFGILVSRFRIFERPISVSLDKINAIVRASCALHNWLRTTSTAYISAGMIDTETWMRVRLRSDQQVQGLVDVTKNIASNNHYRNAAAVRDKFAEYFSGNGSVSWQNTMIH